MPAYAALIAADVRQGSVSHWTSGITKHISLINSPLEYNNESFDPLKVKINIIDKFHPHIESFIDDKELNNVIVGITYEGNEVYFDQGDGDGANYSVSCKQIDT